jgi:hypothetical protein
VGLWGRERGKGLTYTSEDAHGIQPYDGCDAGGQKSGLFPAGTLDAEEDFDGEDEDPYIDDYVGCACCWLWC